GPNRSRAENQASTSPAIGSRTTALPTRRMRTRSPLKRNSFGRRTAWLRPLRKSLATAASDTGFLRPWYISTIYTILVPPSRTSKQDRSYRRAPLPFHRSVRQRNKTDESRDGAASSGEISRRIQPASARRLRKLQPTCSGRAFFDST